MAAASGTIVLPPIVDLDAIDPVRDALLDAIEIGPVVIAASGVERVSTNALLMLLSAAETARRHSLPLVIAAASPAFIAALDRLGLRPQFAGLLQG